MPVESTTGLAGMSKRRGHGQQLAAHRADLGIDLAGVHQRLDEIGQQQNVRIQRQYPIAAGERDGLILRRREADVFRVVDNLAAIFELFQNVHRAVVGGVVDDNDLLVLDTSAPAPIPGIA